MANQSINQGIANSWTLTAFAKAHGKMRVSGELTNSNTGEKFKTTCFTDPEGNRTYVAFSSNLGELTPREIVDMKDDLQVVQLESGNYKLCKAGQSNWEDVDL